MTLKVFQKNQRENTFCLITLLFPHPKTYSAVHVCTRPLVWKDPKSVRTMHIVCTSYCMYVQVCTCMTSQCTYSEHGEWALVVQYMSTVLQCIPAVDWGWGSTFSTGWLCVYGQRLLTGIPHMLAVSWWWFESGPCWIPSVHGICAQTHVHVRACTFLFIMYVYSSSSKGKLEGNQQRACFLILIHLVISLSFTKN